MNITLRPIPWITDNSFFYLKNFLSSRKLVNVLEFGSGASTLWFNNQANINKIISVEHDQNFFNFLKPKLIGNKVTQFCLPKPYNEICLKLKDKFDIIFVDGRNRNKCFASSLPLLKNDGIIVFDNTERDYYSPSFDLWNKSNLGEVTRFQQFGPDITGWKAPRRWETTIFKRK